MRGLITWGNALLVSLLLFLAGCQTTSTQFSSFVDRGDPEKWTLPKGKIITCSGCGKVIYTGQVAETFFEAWGRSSGTRYFACSTECIGVGIVRGRKYRESLKVRKITPMGEMQQNGKPVMIFDIVEGKDDIQ